MPPTSFAQRLLDWYQRQGRKHLPWQQERTPYRVWVSEIMLQQTQVATVIDYYQNFMQRFPDVFSLAQAPQDEVLHLWAGLGYYTRARNLHACAQQLVAEYQGEFPIHCQKSMESLPGIGPSTAAAIIALSSNQRAVIMDGNVKRVIARYFALSGWPGQAATNRLFWQKADQLTPQNQAADYTQAIMDLGATLCTPRQPDCNRCPVASDCQALAQQLTDQLPTPKPKKHRPEKQSYFLLLIDSQEQLLLQQRPQQGIWGGLWSLPEFDSYQAMQKWLKEHYPTAQLDSEPLPSLWHAFSHYRLQLHPWQAQLSGSTTLQEPTAHFGQEMTAPASLWYNPRKPANLGLPAPIQKLLKGKFV